METDKVYYGFTEHKEPKGVIERATLYGPTNEYTSARGTIAMKRVKDEIHYGIAVCSESDNFNKQFGRDLALQRLNQGFGKFPIKTMIAQLYPNEKEMMLFYLDNMVDSVGRKIRKKQRIISQKLSIGIVSA